MALFRVKVRFEQEIEIDVRASSARDAQELAVERVREGKVSSDEIRSSVRTWVEAVDGATHPIGS